MFKVSYLVTCHNETDTLKNLISVLDATFCDPYSLFKNDEIVIIDDFSDNNITRTYLDDTINWNCKHLYPKLSGINVFQHALNNDYGAHKNFGVEQCKGDFIFQIDGDEMPPETLIGENLHALLEANPLVEAFAVPRINAWHGLQESHAKQWGWPLDISPTYNRLRAAWPDYQWRIFKRDYPRISFKKRLHEKIEGYDQFAVLPPDEAFALYHDKTIETQIATNERYNKQFTTDENRGISNPRQ